MLSQVALNLLSFKMQERFDTAVPLEEPVISPAAMFSSSLLVTVGDR
jgi:hypothetical protein